MSLPTILLVDDSEAILTFERAVLGSHFSCVTAADGAEALEKAARVSPAAIVLDLSMPVMDGDEVLRRMKRDERLQYVPVVVVSSEEARASEVLALGAREFLRKPVRAEALLAAVTRAVEQGKPKASVPAILPVSAGGIPFAIPLSSVRRVLPQVETKPLAFGPSFLREIVEVDGEPFAVLDVPRRLGLEHAQVLVDRRLVVVDCDSQLALALCVDEVHDPEELPASALRPLDAANALLHGALGSVLVGVAATARGQIPVVDPRAFVSRDLSPRLRELRGVSFEPAA